MVKPVLHGTLSDLSADYAWSERWPPASYILEDVPEGRTGFSAASANKAMCPPVWGFALGSQF